MILGKLDKHTKKNEIGALAHSTLLWVNFCINLKWSKVYLIPHTIELLEENIGKKLLTLLLAVGFWLWHQSTSNKSKNQQVGQHQTKKHQHRKSNNKMKGQPTEWGEILANHILDKALITKIYEELIQLNSKKNPQTTQLENWPRNWMDMFSKENVQVTNRYIKCCSIIREMQIKTTVRYHLTFVRMATVKKTRNNKC